MPATVTHAFFVKDIYDILPESMQKKLNQDRIKTFAQSTDSLLFYNLLNIKDKKIRDLQHYSHQNNTQEFFINILHYMKDNKITDIDTNSFLVGFISHYVLDSIMHPYIFYKTGLFNKNDKQTYKYNNIHHFMEIFLDNDMIKRRLKTNPYKFNITEFAFNTNKFSNTLNKTINYTFYNTFKVENMDKIYYKSLKQMKNIINVFRRDPYAIKKNIYKLIDTLTPKSCFRFEAISYHYPLNDRHNFLNSNHETWHNPVIYGITSNESFIELYLKAIKIAKVIVCASFDYLDGKDIDLYKIFTNNSYLTGLNCNIKKKMKYFEY